MKSHVLAALALGLLACTSAPAHPATAPTSVTVQAGPPKADAKAASTSERPRARVSLAAVVKQVAPDAKTALVFGSREAALELSTAGIAAETVSETPAHDCLRDLSKRADVVVVDGDIASDCRRDGMLVVSRAARKLTEVQSRNVFADARCTADVCDVIAISEGEPRRWFVPGDLPLTLVHERLSAPAPTRTAFGVILGDTLDLGGSELAGTTRIRLEGAKVAGGRASRDVLVGWWPDAAREALPREIDGLAQVEGKVRLDGSLGLGTIHFPPWQRPADAPAIFSSLASPGTLGTMTAAEVRLVLDAPMIARLNAKEDAALASATKAIKSGELGGPKSSIHSARALLHAGLGSGEDFGRARFLAFLDDQLASTDGFALGEVFLAAKPLAQAPSERAFLKALYERACAELLPVVTGADAALAQKAADFAWKMVEKGSMTPQPVHDRAYKRFGAPKT